MSDAWGQKSLFEAIELQRGFDLPASNRQRGKIPVVASTSVVGSHNESKVDGPGVVIGRSGSIGGAQWIDKDFWPLNTTLWVKDFRGNDPLFVYHLLKSIDFSAFNVGSGVPTLNRNHLSGVEVQLPPYAEQRRIAGVLGALDDLIEVNRGLVTDLDALFHLEWARRFSAPVTGPQVLLSDICSTQYGYTDAATSDSTGPKFLRVADINKRNWIEWDSVPHCSVDARKDHKYRLRKGDLVVARMADPGKSARIESDVDAVFASYLVRIAPSDPALGLYLFGYLKSRQYADYSQGAMTGSVQKNMNAKVITAAPLTLPGQTEIASFNAFGTPIRDAMTALINENSDLESTRDELLPLLMSGRVRVAGEVAA